MLTLRQKQCEGFLFKFRLKCSKNLSMYTTFFKFLSCDVMINETTEYVDNTLVFLLF